MNVGHGRENMKQRYAFQSKYIPQNGSWACHSHAGVRVILQKSTLVLIVFTSDHKLSCAADWVFLHSKRVRTDLLHVVHDPDYRASLNDFNSFLECLTQKIMEKDETVPELPVKDIVSEIVFSLLVMTAGCDHTTTPNLLAADI